MKVELSKAQCNSIADFIEMNLLDVLRKDIDIDNLNYVVNLLTAKVALEKAVKEYEGN